MYERYCKLRDSRNLKDSDVAKATAITPSTFSDWKKGKSAPNADKRQKIASFFGVSVEYLMTGRDTPTREDAPATELTREEWDFLQKLRALDATRRVIICGALNTAYDDMQAEKKDAHAQVA